MSEDGIGEGLLLGFARRLRDLHAQAGAPSLRTLERLTEKAGRQYPRATINDKLKGNSLPDWDFVRTFLAACALPGEVRSEELAEWRGAHTRLLQGIAQSRVGNRRGYLAADQLHASGDGQGRAWEPISSEVWLAPQPSRLQSGSDASPRAELIPSQIPSEPFGFVGRAAEMEVLQSLITPEAGEKHRRCPVAVITGTAGIGKTTLAIRFARQVTHLFPDGQLYVNLRGFAPGGTPMVPATALQWFFDALGVPARLVPEAAEARSALLRTLLDGKRMLLLLDNAHDPDQVRALMPSASGSLVLVTSRSQLTGLVVEGALPVPLDVLDPREAAELLTARLGAERVSRDPDAAAALARHSAGLPLALSVTCARAVARPAMRLADLAAELANARGRLDALATGEASTDLRAVFSWSYSKLSRPATLMFRLLGLHPGPDISAAAAASLAGLSPSLARTALAELARASLVNEDSDGRFGFHDLLRAYATELAAATVDDDERDLAFHRVFDYYLGTAHAAADCLYPARRRMRLPTPLDRVTAEVFIGPAAYEDALAWFTAEHLVLHNVIEHAASRQDDERCWKLAWCWAPLLHRRGRLHDTLAVQRTAALAAGRLSDREALAHVHMELGRVSGSLRDFDTAEEHLRMALNLFTELGDLHNVSQTRYCLAVKAAKQERYEEALDHATDSLRLRRALDDSGATAYSENVMGWILAHLGQSDAALWYCRRALELHQQWGSRSGAADTLDSIAFAYGQLKDYVQSIAHYEQAVELYQSFGDPQGEAHSRLCLGDVQSAAGLDDAAELSWERARTLLSRVQGANLSAFEGRLRGKSSPVDHL
jgi:tetratricopeptide (TPR) repeat protein